MIPALACVLAMGVATIVSILAGLVAGRLNVPIAWLSLGAGASAGVLALLVARPPRQRFTLMQTLMFIAFALFALRAFCWVFFVDDDSLKVLSPNNLGDISLHHTYIMSLVRGARFWPENPIFSGTALHYPLGVDLFNVLLVLAGVDLARSLVWVGLVSSTITAVVLRRWGGAFAMAGFLFNGGLVGFAFLQRFVWQDYNDAVDWKSIPLAMFVTQRGLLYAIPAGLLLLTSWRSRWTETREEAAIKLPLSLEILLFATMPLFNVHTFLFFALLAGWGALLRLVRSPGQGDPRHPLSVIAAALVPGSLCLALVTGLFGSHSAAGSMIHLQAGWMQGEQNFFTYWLMNFGVLPLAVAALLAVGWTQRERPEHRAIFLFVVPSVLIFLLACVVMFAPWEWDNTKIMVWCYLAILPSLWESLLHPLQTTVRAAACLLLFFSGFISLFGGLDGSHQGFAVADRSELHSVQHAVRGLHPDAIFAAHPTYNHPLLLAGCKLVEGYDGHLFSHGIDYQPRLAKLLSLMAGAPDWRKTAGELGVRYLFWGAREEEAYPQSLAPWRTECPLIASGPWGNIYELTR